MAKVYKGPENPFSVDTGALPIPGHEDHEHTVHMTMIDGDDLPDEIKKILIQAAIASGDGDDPRPPDPHPMNDEEWAVFRNVLLRASNAFISGALVSESDSKMTRQEALDGLLAGVKALQNAHDALNVDGGKPAENDDEEDADSVDDEWNS